MSDDNVIGEMRKELGEKAAIKGDPLHETPSREFAQAYRRRSLGFGSNVNPKNFGKGEDNRKSWFCVCGHENKPNRVQKRGGEIVCWYCGVLKSYSEDKEYDENI